MNIEKHRSSGLDEKAQAYWEIFEAVGDGLIIHDLDLQRVVEANTTAAAMHGYHREEFIGLPTTAYIHPDSQRQFTESAHKVQSGGSFESAAVHVRKDGSLFEVEVHRTALLYGSRPCLLSVVRDISKRVGTEKRLNEQADIRLYEQSTLLDISHTLASTLELKPDLILGQLRAIVDYTRAAMFALEDTSLVVVALRGLAIKENVTPFRIQLNGPDVLARLFNEHKPIRIGDVWGSGAQAKFLREFLNDEAPILLDGVQSWMWVPLAVRGRIIGGIGVAHTERDYFTTHHADLALTVANQAAITMINAELYRNAQSLAVLQERQRLAQNLHDAVNQSLFSAGLIAEVLPRLWDRDQEEARRSLEDLRRLTRGAMAEMRALLAELRPSTLTDAELGDLVRLLGNGFTGRTNVPVMVTVTGKGILPAEVQVAIYRICQEALNNVAKHARASKVEVSLKHEESGIDLSIRDDGRGFDTGQGTSGHYGLGMMHERAEAVGANLTVKSEPEHGTELNIHWLPTQRKEAV